MKKWKKKIFKIGGAIWSLGKIKEFTLQKWVYMFKGVLFYILYYHHNIKSPNSNQGWKVLSELKLGMRDAEMQKFGILL